MWLLLFLLLAHPITSLSVRFHQVKSYKGTVFPPSYSEKRTSCTVEAAEAESVAYALTWDDTQVVQCQLVKKGDTALMKTLIDTPTSVVFAKSLPDENKMCAELSATEMEDVVRGYKRPARRPRGGNCFPPDVEAMLSAVSGRTVEKTYYESAKQKFCLVYEKDLTENVAFDDALFLVEEFDKLGIDVFHPIFETLQLWDAFKVKATKLLPGKPLWVGCCDNGDGPRWTNGKVNNENPTPIEPGQCNVVVLNNNKMPCWDPIVRTVKKGSARVMMFYPVG